MKLPNHNKSWSKIGPPLRPTPQVAQHIRNLSVEGDTLLLGVTPEFHPLYDSLTAVDSNPLMLEKVWPGDTESKKAIVADWVTMKWSPATFDNIIGDGGLTMLGDLDTITTFVNQCTVWLRPNGMFIHRLFERPKFPISYSELEYEVQSATGINWHGFKWKIAYHIAEINDGYVALAGVRDMFNKLVTNRSMLSNTTGWPIEEINTIDLYENIDTVTFLPNRQQWSSVIDCDFVDTTGYSLAETCPLMIWKKK